MIHELKWTSRGHQKNEEQALINLIHVQEGPAWEFPHVIERLK
jgi:hypothetical protein